jgi:hypothetical protein
MYMPGQATAAAAAAAAADSYLVSLCPPVSEDIIGLHVMLLP